MSAHTPGPWKVEKTEKVGGKIGPGFRRFIVCAISPGEGDEVVITSRVESEGNERADARLIAATPDLRAELEKADALLRRIEDFYLSALRRKRPEWFRDVQTTIASTSSVLAEVAGFNEAQP